MYFYYLLYTYKSINDLYTIQANEYKKLDWKFRILLSSCVTD